MYHCLYIGIIVRSLNILCIVIIIYICIDRIGQVFYYNYKFTVTIIVKILKRNLNIFLNNKYE